MIKYKRFHIYEGSVKFKLIIIMTIIVISCIGKTFSEILTERIERDLEEFGILVEEQAGPASGNNTAAAPIM